MSKTPKFLPVTERLILVYYEIGVIGRKFHPFKMKIDVKKIKNNFCQTDGLAPFQVQLQAILYTKS